MYVFPSPDRHVLLFKEHIVINNEKNNLFIGEKTEFKDKDGYNPIINTRDENTSTERISIDETQSEKSQERDGAQNDDTTYDKTEQEPIQDDETQEKDIKIAETQEDDTQIDEVTLRQFLGGGQLTVCHVRCIIVGCGNAGKTSLLKRLQNVSYEELIKTDRTEMVDFHVNSFEMLAEENTIQSKLCFFSHL